MSLQEQLDQFRENVVSQLSEEDVATMEAATRELVRAGLARQAKKAGEPAPLFALPNTGGELVELSNLLARGPVVLTFYRGVW
jgi:hypothetical protein